MPWQPELNDLQARKRLAQAMGGPAKVKRQHDAGRLTVRERIDALIDPGSLFEIGTIAGKAEYERTTDGGVHAIQLSSWAVPRRWPAGRGHR